MSPDQIALIIFIASYAFIALGAIPGLALDRTGIALLGAIAMLVTGVLTTSQAVASIDIPTILLLYGLMVLSAQLRLGGFYTHVSLSIVKYLNRPALLLALLMSAAALLSALLANDVVCLSFTPIICFSLLRAKMNPIPFLIALACASNIGSAATIIGNPQNMLIGQVGHLDFGSFVLFCTPPTLLSLGSAYGIIWWTYRGNWTGHTPVLEERRENWPVYDAHQSSKGLLLTFLLVVLFFTPLPRELSALLVAGWLLCSRKITSRSLLGLVDWHLITLFCALFILIAGISNFGLPAQALAFISARGWSLAQPAQLSLITTVLSNLVSNVPAVMLILSQMDLSSTQNLYLLALISTLAGNLFIIGSIANLITFEQAKKFNITLGFATHARIGVPVTIASVGITLGWTLLV